MFSRSQQAVSATFIAKLRSFSDLFSIKNCIHNKNSKAKQFSMQPKPFVKIFFYSVNVDKCRILFCFQKSLIEKVVVKIFTNKFSLGKERKYTDYLKFCSNAQNISANKFFATFVFFWYFFILLCKL